MENEFLLIQFIFSINYLMIHGNMNLNFFKESYRDQF